MSFAGRPWRVGGTSESRSRSLGDSMRLQIAYAGVGVVGHSGLRQRTESLSERQVIEDGFVNCGVDEKDAKSFAGEMIGTDSGTRRHRNFSARSTCFRPTRWIYRIRPKDAKHPVLLPVGEQAQFRLEKDKMLVRVEYVDNKERDYIVVSMTPRSESTADASPVRLNHAQ